MILKFTISFIESFFNFCPNEKDELQNGFVNDYGVDAQKITTQNISATVSGEMKEEAVKAVIIATIGMLHLKLILLF